MLLIYCIQTRRIPTHASAYQIFQILIQYLADTDLTNTALHTLSFDITTNNNTNNNISSKENKYNIYYTISLLHPLISSNNTIIQYNCLWRVSEAAYKQIQIYAQITRKLLQHTDNTTTTTTNTTTNNTNNNTNSSSNSDSVFHEIFMKKKSFFNQYDIYYHIPITIPSFQTFPSTLISNNTHVTLSTLNREIYDLLKYALPIGDRVECLSVHWLISSTHTQTHKNTILSLSPTQLEHSSHKYPTTSSTTTTGSGVVGVGGESECQLSFVVGLVLNGDKSMRKVERGPPPLSDNSTINITGTSNTALMSEFKRFWGPKCELRRFKDGAIVEALIWDDQAASGGGHNSEGRVQYSKGEVITENIIRYILGHHLPIYCGAQGEVLSSVGCRLDQLLPGEATHSHFHSLADYSGDNQVEIKLDPRIESFNYTASCQTIIAHIDSLRKILTSDIKNIPLNIDNLISLDACTRYTSYYPILPHPFLHKSTDDSPLKRLLSGRDVSTLIQPIVLHGTFGHSGRCVYIYRMLAIMCYVCT